MYLTYDIHFNVYMEILTLSNGGESALQSFQVTQDQRWKSFVVEVMASHDKNAVVGDFRKTLRLVKADLNSRGYHTTCGFLHYVIRDELKGRIHDDSRI